MIRKILALSLVLLAVSMVFSGCAKKTEPVETDTDEVKKVEGEVKAKIPAIEGVVEDHSGHNHD
jgi:hypothetical protein